jgi:Domain of unknown function (DUF4386)
MNSTKKTARIAGLLYLVNGVTGFFSIIYVPGKLMVSENAAATANNILASERLFRLGIVSELICAAEIVFLLWVLYRLLGAVNKTHASLMVILGLLQIPIMFVNVLNEIAALSLLRARISCQYSTNRNGRPWPCNSLICMERDSSSPVFFGACGFSLSGYLYLNQASSPAS